LELARSATIEVKNGAHLFVGNTEMNEVKNSFQLIINNSALECLSSRSFGDSYVEWPCQDWRHHHAKDFIRIFESNRPAVTSEYFSTTGAAIFTCIFKFKAFIFLKRHSKRDGELHYFMIFPYTSSESVSIGDRYEIYIHNNMIYFGNEEQQKVVVTPIPSNFIFLQSNINIEPPSLYEFVKNMLIEQHCLEMLKDEVIVHFKRLNELYYYSYNEQYFLLYCPLLKQIEIIYYHEASDQFMVHAVDLIYDRNFILQHDKNDIGNVLISMNEFNRVVSDHSYMKHHLIRHYSNRYLKERRLTVNQLAYFVHYFIHFIFSKLQQHPEQSLKGTEIKTSNICINFFKVYFLLNDGEFRTIENLRHWWNEPHISVYSKLLQLFHLILNAKLSQFSFAPYSTDCLSIELRNLF
jgi:hypothetical protein